ncbi:hypothetical protein QWY81_14365 [Polaribacter undariae]|uniref:Uncharacterized protein n=2 Tax=Polaribacter sejongensis TaxID=985043 RepID=A0AAJ1QYP1_9FLAO|nr:hypothetical protein [Polaribacter undariae]MDN3620646.1 hypothetical protein [Polaribacter undariae]UWD32462.1 hypothetical protein NQP51_02040 [Polaribacter undariae]
MKNEFIIGDIVTLKSHPLFKDKYIKGDGKLVPPFMVIKEVFYEDKKKRTHSEELGKEIADKIKYTCVFFDDNKTEFKDVILYNSMLSEYPKTSTSKKEKESKEKEITYYIDNYEFGKNVVFITNIFEISKERESKKKITNKLVNDEGDIVIKNTETKTIQNLVNYSSPEFILCGIKKNENVNDFYPNGEKRKVISEILYKVKWFNSNQMKFSEIYLPAACFTEEQSIETKALYNLDKKDN